MGIAPKNHYKDPGSLLTNQDSMVSYVRPPVIRGTEASNEELVQSRSTGALTEDPMMSWRVRWPRRRGLEGPKMMGRKEQRWRNGFKYGLFLGV